VARNVNVPVQSRPANTYGPFTVDGRQLGDVGAVITIARSTDGVWPGTTEDPAMDVLWEFDYGQGFVSAGSTRYFGGTRQMPVHLGGGVRLSEFCRILWAKELVDGQLVPVPPDAARVTFVLHQTLNVGASLQWLSQ